MKKPLISILVPVYNVEVYIDECLDSLAGQTYTNLEIILVDDNSDNKAESKADSSDGLDWLNDL